MKIFCAVRAVICTKPAFKNATWSKELIFLSAATFLIPVLNIRACFDINLMMARTYDDTMFIDTFEHEYTWLNGFRRNVRRFSSRFAVIDPERNLTLTYGELDEECNRFANALQEYGVGKDDVVMAALRNSPAFVFAYIAPRKIGSIVLAANFNLASSEMALLINHNKPKVIIYSANICSVVMEAISLCEYKPELLILADNIEDIDVPLGHVSYCDFVKDKKTSEPKINFRPHIYDEVLRLCTSGTTALPKCVPLNDINEVLSAHDVIMHYPLDFHDVTLNMTPWFHRGGCHSGGLCPSLYVGCSILVMRKFQPMNVLDWVEKYKISFLMGAPANLEMLCRVQERKPHDLSGVKGIITMGAPLSKTGCERFMNVLTKNIFNGYGTTETFWNSFLRPYDLPDGAGSTGGSCLDDEVRVVKIYEGRRAEPDDMVAHDNCSEGEIIIFCPEKTTYSYYKDDDMARNKFYKGWMYTGDCGSWDDHWRITVKGRRDDMIIVSGENIYPSQIEEAIMQHPKVRDCAVTALSDTLRGQAVCAYVVPNDPSLSVDEIGQFCSDTTLLSKYKRPRYFAIVDSIPYTATGKKIHHALMERAEQDLKSGILRK